MVVDYESEGIYLAGVAGAGEGRIGLYLLDPASGALRQIASPQAAPFPFGIYLIGGGAGWFGDVAPGDQPPHLGPGAMDRLLRFDLHTKTITAWFRKPGMQVQAIGFDAHGDPIVDAETMTQDTLQTTSQELWLVSGPNSARRIYTGPGATIADVVNFTSVLADDHGVWFGSKLGIFLYAADGQFRRGSTTAADIAGRCS